MKIMNSKLLLISLVLVKSALSEPTTEDLASRNAESQVTHDTVDVRQVMDAYHEAVITRDGARLAALFIQKGAPG